jgi:hypothetical protein
MAIGGMSSTNEVTPTGEMRPDRCETEAIRAEFLRHRLSRLSRRRR